MAKTIACSDGVVTAFNADSTSGYSITVLAGNYLYTFEADSPGEKPVLDSTKTVDLSAGGGGGGGGLVLTRNDGALDKTFAEIKSAAANGVVILHESRGLGGDNVYEYLIEIIESGGTYIVIFCEFSLGEEITPTPIMFMCESPDDYPVYFDPNNGGE